MVSVTIELYILVYLYMHVLFKPDSVKPGKLSIKRELIFKLRSNKRVII